MTEISGRLATTSPRYAMACCGVSTVLVTPGRLSFMQSYLRLQKLHWMLQRGATGRWTRPNFLCASLSKHGWLLKPIGASVDAPQVGSRVEIIGSCSRWVRFPVSLRAGH